MRRAALLSRPGLALFACALSSLLLAGSALALPKRTAQPQFAHSLPSTLWGLETGTRSSTIEARDVATFKRHGVNALVINGDVVHGRRLSHFAALAASTHVALVRAVSVPRGARPADVERHCAASSSYGVCALLAYSLRDARRLFESGSPLVVVYLGSPREVSELPALPRTRIIALPKLWSGRDSAAWAAAIAKARSRAGLDLAAAPVGAAHRSSVARYLALLDQRNRPAAKQSSDKTTGSGGSQAPTNTTGTPTTPTPTSTTTTPTATVPSSGGSGGGSSSPVVTTASANTVASGNGGGNSGGKAPDKQAPTAPTNLAASSVTAGSLSLGWTASTDNVAVAQYSIAQGGVVVGTTPATTYSVVGLACGTAHSFSVTASDAAGNVSPSATVSVTTPACTLPAPPLPPPPPPATSNLYVASSGSDSNACTSAAPCLSLGRAYQLAQPGQVVQVAAGTYGSQVLTGTKTGGACNAFPGGSTSGCVTFAPATGATVTLASLQVQASYVRLQNMTVTGSLDIVDAACAAGQPRDVVLQNMTGATFFVSGGQNVAIVGGSFGGVTNAQSSIQACGDYYVGTYASNVLVDSVRFHDDVWTNSAIHMECLHVSSVSGLSVINSRFENCGVFDIGVNNVNLNGRLVLAGDYFDDARGLNSATSGGSAAIGLSPGEWHLLHNVFAPGAGVADEVYGRTGDTYPNSELGYNVHSDSIQQFFCGAYALAAIQVHNETWGQGGVACGTGSALSSAALPTPPHVLPDGSLG